MKRAVKISRTIKLGDQQPVRDSNDLTDPKVFFLHVLLVVVAGSLLLPVLTGIARLMFGK